MCGITGIVDFKTKIQRELLVKMNNSMVHRGPDHGGVYLNKSENVGLAQRRLSIIDLSISGKQPMCNEDESIWLVYNGEIYNYTSIRKELEELGHKFRSNTDSEVLIHGYEEWGYKILDKLRGMFAFSIWDERKQTLFAARDRVGIKPYYYYIDHERFIFASELKAILAHPNISKEVDDSAIFDYFTYRYIPTPKTILKNAYKLEPGHFLVLSNQKIQIKQYWDVDFAKTIQINEQEAIRSLNEKIDECIDSHLVSDVPLGIFLSGGIDSSLVATLMSQKINEKINSFTIGFSNWDNSEAPKAKLLADELKFNHHQMILDYGIVRQDINLLLELFDEPFSDSSSIPTYYVSKEAKSKVTVALTGDGSDELFGGYNWYTEVLEYIKTRDKWEKVPFAHQIFSIISAIYPFEKGRGKIKGLGSGFWSFYCYKLNGIPREAKSKFFTKEFLKQFKDYDDYWYFKKFYKEELDPLTRLQYLDMKTYLHDDILSKVDRASMASSIEVRVPLLDHTLIELVASFPVQIRNKDFEKKYIFKKAIANILPKYVIEKNKTGFTIPMKNFFDINDIPKVRTKHLESILNSNLQYAKKDPNYIWLLMSLNKSLEKISR